MGDSFEFDESDLLGSLDLPSSNISGTKSSEEVYEKVNYEQLYNDLKKRNNSLEDEVDALQILVTDLTRRLQNSKNTIEAHQSNSEFHNKNITNLLM